MPPPDPSESAAGGDTGHADHPLAGATHAAHGGVHARHPREHGVIIGPVDDTLDLHGMTASEALPAVTAFVQRVRRRQPGAVVHVITGKGKGSPGRPVLRTRVRTLLRSDTLPIDEWTSDLDNGGYLIRLKGR